jgi:hypothetical protein
MVLVYLAADFRRLSISMARVERRDIRLGQFRRFGELGPQPLLDRPAFAVEHPQRQTQRPHVLAAQRLLVAEAERFDAVQRELADVERHDLPPVQRTILQGVGFIASLGQVAGPELARVGDDKTAGPQRIDVGLERCGVHCDQHVGCIARGLDRCRSEVDLERRDPEGCALRRAYLGRKIRESREIIAGQRR